MMKGEYSWFKRACSRGGSTNGKFSVQQAHAINLIERLKVIQHKARTLISGNRLQRRINRVEAILAAIKLGNP